MDIKGMLKTLCGMPESFEMDNEIKFLLSQEATTVNIEALVKLVQSKLDTLQRERNK